MRTLSSTNLDRLPFSPNWQLGGESLITRVWVSNQLHRSFKNICSFKCGMLSKTSQVKIYYAYCFPLSSQTVNYCQIKKVNWFHKFLLKVSQQLIILLMLKNCCFSHLHLRDIRGLNLFPLQCYPLKLKLKQNWYFLCVWKVKIL